MPNYVRNMFIECKYPNKLNKFILNDKGEIDFGILIPMPETLGVIGSLCSDIAKFLKDNKYKSFAYRANTFEEYIQAINSNLNLNVRAFNNQNEFMNNVKDRNYSEIIENVYMTWNIIKYGYPTWYEWSCEKWGTKWNACDQGKWNEYDKGNSIFDTAWSAPTAWLKELAKKVEFVLLYADEDIGSNCGIVESKNGILFRHNNNSNQDSATVFASGVNGYDFSDRDYYSEEEEKKAKQMYNNRYKLMETFFLENNCGDIYYRNEDLINGLL